MHRATAPTRRLRTTTNARLDRESRGRRAAASPEAEGVGREAGARRIWRGIGTSRGGRSSTTYVNGRSPPAETCLLSEYFQSRGLAWAPDRLKGPLDEIPA